MGRVVTAAWDDAAALGFRYGHVLPPTVTAGSRELIQWALEPRRERASFANGQLTLRYVGSDRYARADLASRLDLGSASSTSRPDLTFTEISRRGAARWRARGQLVSPQLVAASVDLRGPIEALWDQERRRHAKRIDRELSCEVRGVDRFDHFYDRMYAPTARKRFAASGYVARRRYLRRLAESGRILFALRGDRAIAGAIVVPVHGRRYAHDLRVWGVIDGEHDPARDALAYEALLVFALRWARARGAERLGLGLAYPFAMDGALRFKKRWGASFHREIHDPRCFAVAASSDVGVRALREVGLIFETAEGLDAVGDETLARRTTPGITRIHQPDGGNALRQIAEGSHP